MHNHSEPVCFTIASCCTCGFQLEIMFLKMVLKQICGTKDKWQTGQCTAITQRFYFTFFWVCVLHISLTRHSFFFFNWMFNYQHGFFSVCFVFTWIMLALLLFFCFVLFCVMWHMSDQWFFFIRGIHLCLARAHCSVCTSLLPITLCICTIIILKNAMLIHLSWWWFRSISHKWS